MLRGHRDNGPPSFFVDVEIGEVGDDDVRAMVQERVGVPGAVDPHDQPEAAPPTRLHAGERVLHHRGMGRRGVEPSCRLEEQRRVGLARESERSRVQAVDPYVEQLR